MLVPMTEPADAKGPFYFRANKESGAERKCLVTRMMMRATAFRRNIFPGRISLIGVRDIYPYRTYKTAPIKSEQSNPRRIILRK